jgi:hypothetical protein
MRKVVWSNPIDLRLAGGNDVILLRHVTYCFDLDGTPFDYIVPRGFRCDLASVPDALASLAANKIESAAGAIFHDHWCREALKLGWDRDLGDSLAGLIWRTPGVGSAVTEKEAKRMERAIKLYSKLIELIT